MNAPDMRSRDFQNRLYWAGLAAAVLILLAEMVSLPLLVTFDGYWYARLAEVLGTSRFSAEWDYLRTPIFPALLKIFFALFGRDPLAVCALQAALGLGGIWLLAATLRRFGRTVEAAILFPLLAAFPTLVTYEHALLTEAGTFFFLALLIYAATARASHPLRQGCILAGVLALGFYHRASILYISPALAAVFAARMWWPSPARAVLRRRGLAAAAVVFLGPFLLAYPWNHDRRVTARTGESVLLYGFTKQAVAPPSDPVWANVRSLYADAIRRSAEDGKLPLNGVRDEFVYPLVDALHGDAPRAAEVFAGAAARYPGRYLAGCLRTSLLFTELYPRKSDNANFRTAILSGRGAPIEPHPAGFPPLDVEMAQPARASVIARILALLAPLYDGLVFLGLLATLAALGVGVWRKDGAILALAVVPLAFLLLSAAVLSSQDRMAAPAYPLLLMNLIAAPGLARPRRESRDDGAMAQNSRKRRR